jgi:spore germination protein GerM
VPRTTGVLRATLEQLVAGPNEAERAAGQSSFFSAETADILAGVTITDDGTAVVDLREPVDGASTSSGQLAFRGALNRTVLQFPTVERVEYRLDGSCDAFWSWQQVGTCQLVTRDDL